MDAVAERAGLRPGLPLAEARALAPALASAPADPDADAHALKRLAAWCGRYSPWTAPDDGHDGGGAAGVLIDATGCAHLFGGEAAMLRDVVACVGRLGLTARAVMAETPGAAWALARFATAPGAPTKVVPEGQARAALSPLPPAALRIGAGETDLLHRLGLRAIGDLYSLPPAALVPRVGRAVARRLNQALGREAESVDPLVPRPELCARRAFAEPIGYRDDLAAGIEALIADLCARLADAGQGARRLLLTLYRVDGTTQPVAVGTSRASRARDHLKRLFAEHLDGLDAGFGVEVMTLAAVATEPLRAGQMALRDGGGLDAKAAGDLTGLIDRLTNRLGAGSVTRPRPAGSHWPERAVVQRPPLTKDRAVWPATPPRPVRLLDPPPEIEATALLPEHPPAQFRWRKLTHRVVRAEGPERLSAEWWRAEGGRRESPLPLGDGQGAGPPHPDLLPGGKGPDWESPQRSLPLGGETERGSPPSRPSPQGEGTRIDDRATEHSSLDGEVERGPRDHYRAETGDGRRYWLVRRDGRWFLHGLFG